MIPELISLEGEEIMLRDVIEPGDYSYLMGSDSFTNEDVRYFESKYPEYMGGIWKAIGKALKAIGKGITKGARRRRSKRQARQIAAERANILQQRALRKQQAYEQFLKSRSIQAMQVQKKRQSQDMAKILIPVIGIGVLAYLLL